MQWTLGTSHLSSSSRCFLVGCWTLWQILSSSLWKPAWDPRRRLSWDSQCHEQIFGNLLVTAIIFPIPEPKFVSPSFRSRLRGDQIGSSNLAGSSEFFHVPHHTIPFVVLPHVDASQNNPKPQQRKQCEGPTGTRRLFLECHEGLKVPRRIQVSDWQQTYHWPWYRCFDKVSGTQVHFPSSNGIKPFLPDWFWWRRYGRGLSKTMMLLSNASQEGLTILDFLLGKLLVEVKVFWWYFDIIFQIITICPDCISQDFICPFLWLLAYFVECVQLLVDKAPEFANRVGRGRI